MVYPELHLILISWKENILIFNFPKSKLVTLHSQLHDKDRNGPLLFSLPPFEMIEKQMCELFLASRGPHTATRVPKEILWEDFNHMTKWNNIYREQSGSYLETIPQVAHFHPLP